MPHIHSEGRARMLSVEPATEAEGSIRMMTAGLIDFLVRKGASSEALDLVQQGAEKAIEDMSRVEST